MHIACHLVLLCWPWTWRRRRRSAGRLLLNRQSLSGASVRSLVGPDLKCTSPLAVTGMKTLNITAPVLLGIAALLQFVLGFAVLTRAWWGHGHLRRGGARSRLGRVAQSRRSSRRASCWAGGMPIWTRLRWRWGRAAIRRPEAQASSARVLEQAARRAGRARVDLIRRRVLAGRHEQGWAC